MPRKKDTTTKDVLRDINALVQSKTGLPDLKAMRERFGISRTAVARHIQEEDTLNSITSRLVRIEKNGTLSVRLAQDTLRRLTTSPFLDFVGKLPKQLPPGYPSYQAWESLLGSKDYIARGLTADFLRTYLKNDPAVSGSAEERAQKAYDLCRLYLDPEGFEHLKAATEPTQEPKPKTKIRKRSPRSLIKDNTKVTAPNLHKRATRKNMLALAKATEDLGLPPTLRGARFTLNLKQKDLVLMLGNLVGTSYLSRLETYQLDPSLTKDVPTQRFVVAITKALPEALRSHPKYQRWLQSRNGSAEQTLIQKSPLPPTMSKPLQLPLQPWPEHNAGPYYPQPRERKIQQREKLEELQQIPRLKVDATPDAPLQAQLIALVPPPKDPHKVAKWMDAINTLCNL